MDPRAFCTSTRVLIVAGKGGVGKTTVSATVARMAAAAGVPVLLIEVEGRSRVSELFDRPGPLGYHQTVLLPAQAPAAEVLARTLTPDDALVEYLDDHGMRRISRRLSRTGAVDVVATGAPGIKDILVLGKIKQIERDRWPAAQAAGVGLIVVDAPAAGHAVQFLESADGLLDAVQVGPIRAQARDVADLLADAARCRVLLVTLAEETPVNEVIETAYALEDRVGVHLGPVVVNAFDVPQPDLAVDPEEAAEAAGVTLAAGEADALRRAAAFRWGRQQRQAGQAARLADALPLAQVRLPLLLTDRLGGAELERLAAAFAAGLEPQPDRAAAPAG